MAPLASPPSMSNLRSPTITAGPPSRSMPRATSPALLASLFSGPGPTIASRYGARPKRFAIRSANICGLAVTIAVRRPFFLRLRSTCGMPA